MSTSGRDRLVVIGRVGRPHGVDGAFVVEHASEDPARFAVGASLLADGEPALIDISRRVGHGRVAIRLDRRVERGAELAVRREDLPPADPDAFYVADLVGLETRDEEGNVLGVVQDVIPGPANDNLELDSGLLVPLVEDAVREIDVAGGRIVLNADFID